MSDLIDKEGIETEFKKQIEDLKASIERVGLRQDELKGYIFDLTEINNKIKLDLTKLPKESYEVKPKLYMTIQKNSELIGRFYDTISSFEGVRQRYQQDIGKLTKDKVYLLNIEIKRVENKIEGNTNTLVTFMKELRSLVSSASENPEISNKIMSSLENNPIYSLE